MKRLNSDSDVEQEPTKSATKLETKRPQRNKSAESTTQPLSQPPPQSNAETHHNNPIEIIKPKLVKWVPGTADESAENTVLSWTEDLIPKTLKKYWRHRHSLFTRFDEGVKMDEEAWYSVTPEKVAKHIAARCTGKTVIDAFCGAGGNSIQFALAGYKVIAVDIDPVKLACTHHNAKLYGALGNIEFIHGDFMKVATQLKGDVVFLSPPWGGPDYLKEDTFDIKTMMPIDGEALFNEASKITKNIIYYMPKSSDQDQLTNLAGPGNVCEHEEVYLNDRAKVLVTYYGDLVAKQ
ncbi:S-adenosyl-L-methionine-dependent methyltransferase [Rhizoclosmatium globosum]|uniref:Trimethylguanosine synthase n=1 Tax=Rhizoclosmatium globosum TaxID=329046 RepID=A0A1Y2ABW7_9FUNG|nr:S-adenosyl-L-methionine-dependent methyltransferase [Rhizoclosmatium globosum]|eukprot:ORY20002.1 S-adenosyl-L-methionine-dependent methyltransferase [Rhizoclosmatium globosum]